MKLGLLTTGGQILECNSRRLADLIIIVSEQRHDMGNPIFHVAMKSSCG
jgi:hypothetical protein